MMMELYFGRPSLVRIFYHFDKINFLTLHTHDLDLNIERDNIIYLFREPVVTIFSQVFYHHSGDINNKEKVSHWADLYGRHLDKWLFRENFTKKKLIVRYENLEADIYSEFKKVVDFFNEPFDKDRLSKAVERVTKEEVKGKTAHDHKVISRDKFYELKKNKFKKRYNGLIMKIIFDKRIYLRPFFKQND
jgi:hypothetical protein